MNLGQNASCSPTQAREQRAWCDDLAQLWQRCILAATHTVHANVCLWIKHSNPSNLLCGSRSFNTKIGLFMSLTLAGDVIISLALTFVADALGRQCILILGSLLMTLSGVCFTTISIYWILLLAAVVGVISPSGNEIGPFRAVEKSALAHLSEAATRSNVFAWYVVIGTLGTAGGSFACGWITQGL